MESQNQVATLANITDLTEGRDKAIAIWLESYDTHHRLSDLAASICIAGRISVAGPTDRNSELPNAFMSTADVRIEDRATWKQSTKPAREAFAELMTREIDRRCWRNVLDRLEFDKLLDRQAREEFAASLRDNPPEFTVDNCTATFSHLWGNRREMYLRGIANVFMSMDRRFRSHDAFAIGHRLIIDGAISPDSAWWRNYERRDTLHDVERIFRELDGLPPLAPFTGLPHHRAGEPMPDEPEGIVGKVIYARQFQPTPCVVECDYFRVRIFGNGNLHLWFTRKDLLAQINKLLLEYYNPIEGDIGEGPDYESAPAYHATPAKNFGAFNSNQAVADKVMAIANIQRGDRVLEPSAGSGMLARAAREAGADVTCIEIQPGLAHELYVVHGFKNSHVGDFLKIAPNQFQPFDRIVMNPPFDRGRDCDHVRHAFDMLKPGGTLVAVMSSRAEFATDKRHQALHKIVDSCRNKWGQGGRWIDLPPCSFAHAGTNVNTVILTLQKPS